MILHKGVGKLELQMGASKIVLQRGFGKMLLQKPRIYRKLNIINSTAKKHALNLVSSRHLFTSTADTTLKFRKVRNVL